MPLPPPVDSAGNRSRTGEGATLAEAGNSAGGMDKVRNTIGASSVTETSFDPDTGTRTRKDFGACSSRSLRGCQIGFQGHPQRDNAHGVYMRLTTLTSNGFKRYPLEPHHLKPSQIPLFQGPNLEWHRQKSQSMNMPHHLFWPLYWPRFTSRAVA